MNEITGMGIDVPKGYSMIAADQPGGVTLLALFRVNHTASGLQSLVERIRTLPGEVRIVMKHTGSYWQPIALTLVKAGFFVSVVNAMLIHDFRDNSLRRVKTDKADALKITNYALAFWPELRPYTAEDETRQLLKMQYRLYERTLASSVALRNSLISLLDQVFPGVNRIFYQMVRADNGHVKWVGFVRTYWHQECVSSMPKSRFMESYRRWCKKEGYRFTNRIAEKLYTAAREGVPYLPKCTSTKMLVCQSVDALNAVYNVIYQQRGEMLRLAKLLPKFDVVMGMAGTGSITGPKIMGEIGDLQKLSNLHSALILFG